MNRPRQRYRRRSRPLWRILLDLALVVVLAAGLLKAAGLFGDLNLAGGAKVIDGDSLNVDGEEIRLHGIDAPEYRQSCDDAQGKEYPCGQLARDHLKRLLQKGEVTCTVIDRDRYGRSVADCKAGTIDLNKTMVADGWAVAYLRHAVTYALAEAQARKARRGIWQGEFTPPEQWRDLHRGSLQGNSAAPD